MSGSPALTVEDYFDRETDVLQPVDVKTMGAKSKDPKNAGSINGAAKRSP
jgi:hypothetical protein